jgi:hypothetical protein
VAGERYQQLWLKGAPVDAPYQRECEPRYDAIRSVVKKFERPVSVFDLGANMGYFSFRLAEEFPDLTAIAADNKPDLSIYAEKNELDNVLVIPRRLSPFDIKDLSQCESFDVALALNVLHHMDDHDRTIDWLLKLADVLVIETPGVGDINAANPDRHKAILKHLEKRGAVIMARTHSHVSDAERLTYVIDQLPRKKKLRWQSIDAQRRGCQRLENCLVESSYEKKTISLQRYRGPHENRKQVNDFIPGMNLWNWHKLGGSWPNRNHVIGSLKAAAWRGKRWHDDIRPWNFILSADTVRAIDDGWKPKRPPEMAEEWARYDLTETLSILNGRPAFGWKSDEEFI